MKNERVTLLRLRWHFLSCSGLPVFLFNVSLCVSALLEFNQSVLVSRKDPESRKRTVTQVTERLTSNGYWPQVRCSTNDHACLQNGQLLLNCPITLWSLSLQLK